MNWQLQQDFQISLLADELPLLQSPSTYPNGGRRMYCTPRDKEKIWQKANFRRIVYSFIWLIFSLNLRNVAQIQDYDECSKPNITQSFVETNEHHEFTPEAMKFQVMSEW